VSLAQFSWSLVKTAKLTSGGVIKYFRIYQKYPRSKEENKRKREKGEEERK